LKGEGKGPEGKRFVEFELKKEGEQYRAATFLEIRHTGEVRTNPQKNGKAAASVFFLHQKFELHDLGHCDGTVNKDPTEATGP
jgi:hypothetical protein